MNSSLCRWSSVVGLSSVVPFLLCAAAQVPPPPAHLKFVPVEVDVGSQAAREARRLFTTPAQFETFFDQRAPAEVDWDAECVVYYSAGVQPTGGYESRILDVQSTEGGRSLMITTSLESPGPNCVVTEALTRPYVLVRFERPAKQFDVVRFGRADVEIDCKP